MNLVFGRLATTAVLLLAVESAAGRVEIVDGALTVGTGRLKIHAQCLPAVLPPTAIETSDVLTWTRVRSRDGGAIVHLYYHRDALARDPVVLQWRLASTVVLDVPAGATGWRTWSTKTVSPGEWRVDVRDLESTDLLCTIRFEVASGAAGLVGGDAFASNRQGPRTRSIGARGLPHDSGSFSGPSPQSTKMST